MLLTLSLLFMTLTVLRSAGQVSCKACPNLGLSDVFLITSQGDGVSESLRQKVRCPFIHVILGVCETHTASLPGSISLFHLVNVVFVWFLHCEVT